MALAVGQPQVPLRGTMVALQDAEAGKWVKVLIAGKPKSAGKTTFALSAPGKKLHIAYDLGYPPRGIPGVDEGKVWTVQYEPALQVVKVDSDRWTRPSNVGEQIIRDIETIRNAFVGEKEVIEFANGATCPLPDTLILDGMTEMPLSILDWVLSVNKKFDPEDFDNKFTAWRKRLNTVRQLLHMLLPLPCHVVLVAWETTEMIDMKATGKIIPDVGGKLDNVATGKTGGAIRCYASYQNNAVQYMVQMKPDGIREWVGVRGRYDNIKAIDVTINPAKPDSPWQRVFGEAGMYVRPKSENGAVSINLTD